MASQFTRPEYESEYNSRIRRLNVHTQMNIHDLSEYQEYFLIINKKREDDTNIPSSKEYSQTEFILSMLANQNNIFEGKADYLRYHDRSGNLRIQIKEIIKSLPFKMNAMAFDGMGESEAKQYSGIEFKVEDNEILHICTSKGLEILTYLPVEFNTATAATSEDTLEEGVMSSEPKPRELVGAFIGGSYYETNNEYNYLILPMELYTKYKQFLDTVNDSIDARYKLISYVLDLESKVENIIQTIYSPRKKSIFNTENPKSIGYIHNTIFGIKNM
jgi:hypothetical protein